MKLNVMKLNGDRFGNAPAQPRHSRGTTAALPRHSQCNTNIFYFIRTKHSLNP